MSFNVPLPARFQGVNSGHKPRGIQANKGGTRTPAAEVAKPAKAAKKAAKPKAAKRKAG